MNNIQMLRHIFLKGELNKLPIMFITITTYFYKKFIYIIVTVFGNVIKIQVKFL